MLETIITETTSFFLSGFSFMNIHDSQDNRGRERLSFYSILGTNFFGERIYGEVIPNRRTNDQIMPRWGRSFINDKCIFQYSEHRKTQWKIKA